MTYPWWTVYAIPYPVAVLIAICLGGSWKKRVLGAVGLCLLVTLSMWSSLNEFASQMPETKTHVDPPPHFWKVPPIP